MALSAGPSAQATPDTLPAAARSAWDRAAATFERALDRAGIVGGSLTLVVNDRPAGDARHGFQDLDARRAVDADTVYHWASITKTFTGIAIMQLRDRGRLSLDDAVVSYVPELKAAHSRFGDMSQVKIRHLMSHSAGFRASTWPWGGDEPWHPFEPTQWAQLVAMLPYTELQFAPGTQYSYSNPGVIFLGRIIELLSGDDYETYVTKNILMPLGMHHTFFDRAPYHLLPNRSHSYFRTAGALKEARFDFDTGITVSNGGLNAPFGDMTRYLAFLIGAPGHPEYDAVLPRASLHAMWEAQVAARDGEGASGTDARAALSFFVERYGDVELVGHSGNQNGFLSHLYLHRPTMSGYVVAFNTDASATADGPSLTRDVDTEIRTAMLDVFRALGR